DDLRRLGRSQRMGEAELLRELPSDRANRTPGPAHAAFWADEAGGTQRSADWQPALCRGAIAPREPTRRVLQSGRIPESFEVRRASPSTTPDSGTRKCAVSALRPNSPQHVYQFTGTAHAHAPDESASERFVCGTDLRS